ncbi:MAG TPA: peptidoglycan DD-metalloendopeptidase family protein, partial [Rhodocyclaceae bacterium]|nr:peptidoglycan DD-metalloendopeptidase family protein [Rhodocyclaceae bacterium]
VEAQQRKQQDAMLAQRQQRQKMLLRISSRLDSQKREIETLRRDEKRLTGLIDRIQRLLAEKAKKRASKPPPGKERLATDKKGEKPSPKATQAGASEIQGGRFASLRGKLSAPTSGVISQKFGAAQDGGGKSKGIFIRSAAGGDVRAIADGQVVFADWLRGFGNLIVLDHEDGFLSVYGYNEAVLKQVGDEVRSGDRIAAIGNSGGRSETGLYFELRRRGEAIDPGQWLRR